MDKGKGRARAVMGSMHDVTCFPRLPVTGDPKRVTCHRLCFVMVSRHLVMLALQSLDMLYCVMCFPNLPVTRDPKRVTCHRLCFVML